MSSSTSSLANQDLTYLETEQDKVNFFCNELGLPRVFLPGKVYGGASHDQKTIRYFVKKSPLYIAPPLPGVPPVVTFSYVDAGFERPSSFTAHLAAYRPLFQQLNNFRFLYVAPKEPYFRGAEERFRSATEDDNLQVRLEEEVRNNLDRDAEFIDANPPYVVSEILKLLHHKDRKFQSWLSGQHTNNREPVLKGETLQMELK